MVIKVAHKVSIGFGVILLLLIFTSVSSIGILSTIEDATETVNTLAIPTQQQSNALQINLLKQGKLSSQIPNATNLSQVENIEQAYQVFGEQLVVSKVSSRGFAQTAKFGEAINGNREKLSNL